MNRSPTTLADWTREDNYQNSFLIDHDDDLENALKASTEAGLPEINVTAAQGKFLQLLARSIGAKKILELGTLGGYSTIWLARALPDDGQLISCEVNEVNANVARKNIERAGLSSKVSVILGAALDTLANLKPEPPFDFIFIDADKPNNGNYFAEAKRLVKKGGVIIVDNVVRNARVSDMRIQNDVNCDGVRDLLKRIKGDKEVDCTTIGTVGEKGYDGFLYAVRV
ncbi:hypothetical protein JAAARDRAFT_31862 [Jaapia argillacea MUCL 33604]|uniref:O-methyltransferase family 3 protein n=1 Tax=Jaapia argillacea MUCL 33604 TaxID=933084 RepID=A0A067QBH0_9AGAM|nr:hypothetical protein JAAARDRAFT_31862 [Jaapia argillacea MUCL 33604]